MRQRTYRYHISVHFRENAKKAKCTTSVVRYMTPVLLPWKHIHVNTRPRAVRAIDRRSSTHAFARTSGHDFSLGLACLIVLRPFPAGVRAFVGVSLPTARWSARFELGLSPRNAGTHPHVPSRRHGWHRGRAGAHGRTRFLNYFFLTATQRCRRCGIA